MIKVKEQPELSLFDEKVRKPGEAFLKEVPKPIDKQWASHRYWSRISLAFYKCYGGICAYTGLWFSLSNTDASIDHFLPKNHYPSLAYEWNNYRLTTIKTNRNKGTETIIDPFEIEDGWFVLEIPTCLIKPSLTLPKSKRQLIEHTIKVLKLNSDDNMVQERLSIIEYYIQGNIDFDFLERRYPFIAKELIRQNLKNSVGEHFKTLA